MATGPVISSGSFVIGKEQIVPYVKPKRASESDVNVALQQTEPEAIEKVQTTNAAGTQEKVSVMIKASDKTANDLVPDEEGQINEEFEFREEVGGYEDYDEDIESTEDENGPTEMDEEGGYKDEDEEFEDC
ncbi:hypothetical protein GHT06_008439 [Daphnia sinensis]|uniref:Uncharacterized protein n=1 Tax=Daphnia sinensis TaxID=1820382 RepID=A0AAD5LLZ3_9CRUS|nr:hypothetical protein GHT06_008439 [Daphnia sinensis]